MQQLISVIIPVYNHAHTLKKSFESLRCQTYKNLEVIIVNDGSADGFENLVPDLLKQDIKVINQTNQGAANARNRGFKEAKGEYVIFWDADTIAKPEMIAKMAEVLEKNPSANYAYCDFKFGWKKMHARQFDAGALKKQNYIDTTSLIRAQDFCGFDESLKRLQDWDLWLTMLEKKKTGVYLPECLYKKVVNGRNGYSTWQPKLLFNLFFKTEVVKNYEKARLIVVKKHRLE